MRGLLLVPYSFVVLNLAAVAGLYYFITGRKDLWSSNRCVHARNSLLRRP